MSGNLDVVVHESASVCKVWVFGIDVSQLDRHQVVNLEHNATIYRKIDLHLNYLYRNCLVERNETNHLIGDRQPLPEQRRDHFNYGIMQLWKPQQLLVKKTKNTFGFSI